MTEPKQLEWELEKYRLLLSGKTKDREMEQEKEQSEDDRKMCEVLEKLRAWGCDLDGALERFLGDEELYKSCLPMVAEDESFDGLKEALAEDERKKAFDCAHTLKGVFANMGITPMFDTVEKIVEPLRAGINDGLMPVYEELSREREHLRSIIRIEGE